MMWYAGAIASVAGEVLHSGCNCSVMGCADSSDLESSDTFNSQISLSDLAFAMELDASELAMAEPPIPSTHAYSLHLLPSTLPAESAVYTFKSQAPTRTRSTKQLEFVGRKAREEPGHSLGDAAMIAIAPAQIATILAIAHNATLLACNQQQRAHALSKADEPDVFSRFDLNLQECAKSPCKTKADLKMVISR